MIPPQDRFKRVLSQLVSLTKEISEKAVLNGCVTGAENDITNFERGISCITSRYLIENFVVASSDTWDKIATRDQSFLRNNASTLFNLTDDKLCNLDAIISGDYVDDEDKDMVWKFLDSMIRISINFIHEERCPGYNNGVPEYAREYVQNLDIQNIAEKWNVKLKWPNQISDAV